MWLSLGPIPKAGDSLVSGLGLYNVLYDYVPGFNGVRAPSLATFPGSRGRRHVCFRRTGNCRHFLRRC